MSERVRKMLIDRCQGLLQQQVSFNLNIFTAVKMKGLSTWLTKRPPIKLQSQVNLKPMNPREFSWRELIAGPVWLRLISILKCDFCITWIKLLMPLSKGDFCITWIKTADLSKHSMCYVSNKNSNLWPKKKKRKNLEKSRTLRTAIGTW